jgi:hypothetical protein
MQKRPHFPVAPRAETPGPKMMGKVLQSGPRQPVPWPEVKFTLRLTVSQSVCLGVEPALGIVTRDFFPSKLLSRLCVAPYPTRDPVCPLPVFCQYSGTKCNVPVVMLKIR